MIKNLKKLRENAGISQQQLANIIMVSQQSVNKYENHNIEPDNEILIKIAEYFNVSLDYLLGRTDVKEMVNKLCTSDLTEDEVVLVNNFRRLNSNQKDSIINLLKNFK